MNGYTFSYESTDNRYNSTFTCWKEGFYNTTHNDCQKLIFWNPASNMFFGYKNLNTLAMRTPIKTKGIDSIKILRNIVFRFNKDGGKSNEILKLALKETS